MRILITEFGPMMLTSESDSVAHDITAFLQHDQAAKGAAVSAKDADAVYPSLVKRLFKHLMSKDIDSRLLECEGPKFHVDKTASDELIEQSPAKITHAVVVVGKMVIDPCKLRFGQKYELPLSYPEPLLKTAWTLAKDITHLATMTPEQVRVILKGASNKSGDRE